MTERMISIMAWGTTIMVRTGRFGIRALCEVMAQLLVYTLIEQNPHSSFR
jgi:hypothetical protein